MMAPKATKKVKLSQPKTSKKVKKLKSVSKGVWTLRCFRSSKEMGLDRLGPNEKQGKSDFLDNEPLTPKILSNSPT